MTWHELLAWRSLVFSLVFGPSFYLLLLSFVTIPPMFPVQYPFILRWTRFKDWLLNVPFNVCLAMYHVFLPCFSFDKLQDNWEIPWNRFLSNHNGWHIAFILNDSRGKILRWWCTCIYVSGNGNTYPMCLYMRRNGVKPVSCWTDWTVVCLSWVLAEVEVPMVIVKGKWNRVMELEIFRANNVEH